jgi:3-hydroxyisobutyrate dehydrogenase
LYFNGRIDMNIAVLGLGLMGRAITERLAKAGMTVRGYNRSPLSSPPIGVTMSASVAAAVEPSDIVWVMLADFAACESVLLAENPWDLFKNKLIINGATIGPDQSRALAESIEKLGGHYLEAPVLGSTPQAETGTLQILVGGDPADVAVADPVLKALGKPTRFGGIGQGAAVKLAMNQLIGSLTAAFSMSLGLVEREGVDVDTFMHTLRESALYAPTFDKKLQRMRDRDFAKANFPLKHLLKDIRLFAEVAGTQQIDARMLDGLGQILSDGVGAGHADEDYSAVFGQIVPKVTP